MKYYTAGYSTGKEIGRDYPQLHCLTQSYAHQLSAWEFPPFKPELDFELNKRAILTDVLSNAAISAFGFIISRRTRDIFESFSLIKYKIYDVNIQIPRSGERLKYHYLHISEPDLVNSLDYASSVFYEQEYVFRTEKIKIDSYKHYLKMKSADKQAKFGVDLDEIYVTDKFNKNLDMFVFLPFSGNIYISERLKDALESEKISGLTFDDATEIRF